MLLAAGALAVLPGSSAATRGRAKAAPASPEVARASAAPGESARAARAPRSPATLVPNAFFYQAAPAPPSVATYAADCATPKSDFNLGETVCVKVEDIPTSGAAVVLNDPDNFVRSNALGVTASSQSFNFALPSSANSGDGTDNRGAWTAAVINTEDNSRNVSARFFVHDAQQTVADVTISKTLLDTAQATAGGNTSYRVYVTNQGPDAAANVSFTDHTMPNTTFVSFTDDGASGFNCARPSVGSAGQTVCTKGAMAVGSTASFTAVYKLSASVGNGAPLEDTIDVASDTYDSRDSSNSSTVEGSASNPTPPACTISCPANITQNSDPGQPGAVVNYAAPAATGTCSPVTTDIPSGSVFPVGTTLVTANAGNGATCSFFVTVNPEADTQNPSISCPGDITVDESSGSANSATVNYSVAATDNSGSAVVDCDPPPGSTFPAGTTPVHCTATDPSGNSSSCDFNVTVNQVGCDIDANSAPPVPKVAQLPTITGACSVTLLPTDDPNATDACGGNVNAETASERVYDSPGTYTVVWTYTDSFGNKSTQNQTVVIAPDNTLPVPDAASLPTVTGECSVTVTAKPTATDNCAGVIEGATNDPLTYTGVGTYTVHWNYTDNAGNTTQQNQTVVVTDTHPPVVTLNGPSSVTVECHTSYADAGAGAGDNCSATPTLASTSDVNVNVPGTYHVVWTATDAGGNHGTATRTVTVVDSTIPVITLNGANPLTILLNSAYVEPGATAADSCAGTFPATASGAVNTNAVGTYTITYNATDPAGNAAAPVTRTVKVIYNFTGFFSPVNNLPTINQMNAGRSIPVKFSLAGNRGLGILAAGSPYSQQVNCSTSAPIADIEATDTPGNSTLTYDAGSNQYNYNWKSEKSWAGTCRVLTVALNDGTTHTAAFKFK